MYGMNSMMYGMMFAPMMFGSMTSPNVPSYFHQRYGYGHEDFGTNPYLRHTPMALTRCYLEQPPKEIITGDSVTRTFKSYLA